MAERHRLDDQAVTQRLARVDELLERVERTPGPTAQAAIQAVQALTDIYGEALARVLDGDDPRLADRLAGDELVSHLLVLHGLHPDPVERRAARAVDELRPAARERGHDIELVGVGDGIADVRMRSKGCGSSSSAIGQAVREAVLALTPELTDVRHVSAPATDQHPAFVPLASLRPRPTTPEPGAPA